MSNPSINKNNDNSKKEKKSKRKNAQPDIIGKKKTRKQPSNGDNTNIVSNTKRISKRMKKTPTNPGTKQIKTQITKIKQEIIFIDLLTDEKSTSNEIDKEDDEKQNINESANIQEIQKDDRESTSNQIDKEDDGKQDIDECADLQENQKVDEENLDCKQKSGGESINMEEESITLLRCSLCHRCGSEKISYILGCGDGLCDECCCDAEKNGDEEMQTYLCGVCDCETAKIIKIFDFTELKQQELFDHSFPSLKESTQTTVKAEKIPSLDDIAICGICCTDYRSAFFECGHSYCRNCAKKILEDGGGECSFCRAKDYEYVDSDLFLKFIVKKRVNFEVEMGSGENRGSLRFFDICTSMYSISDLKKKIKDIYGYPIEKQTLMYGFNVIPDHVNLGERTGHSFYNESMKSTYLVYQLSLIP